MLLGRSIKIEIKWRIDEQNDEQCKNVILLLPEMLRGLKTENYKKYPRT
jgi:hypothetical protein